MLEHVGVLRNYVVEGDLGDGCDFANPINRTHHHLVQMPVDQQVRLGREEGFHNFPDLLLDVLLDPEILAKL